MKDKFAVGSIVTEQVLEKAYDAHAVNILIGYGDGDAYIKEQDKTKKGERRKYKILKELPAKEVYLGIRDKRYTYTVAGLIEDAQGEIEGLAEELTSWRDNISGTGLENTDKYSQVDEAASTLENIQVPDTGDLPDIPIIQLPELSHRTGRAHRAGVAAGWLRDAAEALTTYADEKLGGESGKRDDVEQVASECESVADELEGVDFPGMF